MDAFVGIFQIKEDLAGVSRSKYSVGGFISRFFGDLRFPQLFVLAAIVFAINLLIPDAVPFIDEILLGLVTLLLGSLTKRKVKKKNPPIENSSSEGED